MKKKTICTLLIAALLLSGCGNNQTVPVETTAAETEPSCEKGENTSAYYDDIFKGIQPNGSGMRSTYEETIDMINDGTVDSYYLVETVRVVPLNECVDLLGWDENYSDRTVYEVRVISDIITGEKSDKSHFVLISMGTPEYQVQNNPTYAPGELFTVVLTKENSNSDFVKSTGGYAFRYDAVRNNDSYILYSRNNIEMDELNIPGSVNINESVITSTTSNPVLYTQKLSISDLSEFIKSDWSKKRIGTHFEK